MIAELEGIHAWTPPGAGESAIELGRVTDAKGDPVWPRFKLRRITGLRSQGTAEDNKSAKVGAIGENPERSERRGKSVVYEGTIEARTLKELREAEDTLMEAFADITLIGRMDVSWHELNDEFKDEVPKFYEAKCLTADVPGSQDTKGWKRLFVVGLWLYDPRYFDEETEVHTVEVKETNTAVAFS